MRRMVLPLALLLLGAAPPAGYLARPFDVVPVLPAAPRPGEPRYAADRATYADMKALIGSPRWALATADVRQGADAMLGAFACAAGVRLTGTSAPATVRLLTRASIDASRAAGGAKRAFRRRRPFTIDAGETCQPKRELIGSYDYPSGHTTHGWTIGLLLAALMPDRATPILARARAYGESRIVCRVHNATAVEAGRTTAAATLAVIGAEPAFAADLAAARIELARLRADQTTPHPDPAACAAEARLVAQPVVR